MSSSPDNSPPGSNEPNNTNRAKRPRRIPRRQIIRPEIGSLYDLMHEHAGTSLYVLPICWTDLHSKVLDVRFRELDKIVTPVPKITSDSNIYREPSKIGRMLTTELHVLLQNETQRASVRLLCKVRAMKFIMSTFFPSHLSRPKSNADLDLYFGTRVFKKAVRVHCLWKSVEDPLPLSSFGSFDSVRTVPFDWVNSEPTPNPYDYRPNLPVLAYLNRYQLSLVRENLFRVVLGPDKTPNEPVTRLQRLRSKMLIPENINHDPYIVAILIAMAQTHFYRPVSRSSSQSSESGKKDSVTLRRRLEFEDVKVQLITHDENGNDSDSNFIVYTAIVTADFLNRFAYPDKAGAPISEEAGSLQITHTPVAVWPILGLRERLAKALGREIAGDPPSGNPEHIALWDALIEPTRPSYPLVSIKRRRSERPPLSEVLNSSFEEDCPSSSDDHPILSPSAKRRRTAQPVSALEVC